MESEKKNKLTNKKSTKTAKVKSQKGTKNKINNKNTNKTINKAKVTGREQVKQPIKPIDLQKDVKNFSPSVLKNVFNADVNWDTIELRQQKEYTCNGITVNDLACFADEPYYESMCNVDDYKELFDDYFKKQHNIEYDETKKKYIFTKDSTKLEFSKLEDFNGKNGLPKYDYVPCKEHELQDKYDELFIKHNNIEVKMAENINIFDNLEICKKNNNICIRRNNFFIEKRNDNEYVAYELKDNKKAGIEFIMDEKGKLNKKNYYIDGKKKDCEVVLYKNYDYKYGNVDNFSIITATGKTIEMNQYGIVDNDFNKKSLGFKSRIDKPILENLLNQRPLWNGYTAKNVNNAASVGLYNTQKFLNK